MSGFPAQQTAATGPRLITFSVAGVPVPQGSMRAPAAGVVLHGTPRLRGWRDAVSLAARQAYKGEPWAGPVQMELWFSFKTPRAHRGKTLKTTTPDLDKLQRAVLDALTGVVYLDDAQVYHITASKNWTNEPDELGLGVELWLQSEEGIGNGA